MTKESKARFVLNTNPEEWPEVDDFPEADTRDLETAFRNTVESEEES